MRCITSTADDLKYTNLIKYEKKLVKNMKRYQRILAAVDGSKEATKALNRGINLAKRYDSRLFICHVVETKEYSRVPVYREEIKQAAVENGLEILKACEKTAEEAGVKDIVTIMKRGVSPQKMIAEEIIPLYTIELAITGASGAGLIESYLLGSVSAGMVHLAGCDVMVVKNKAFTENYRRILVAIDESEMAVKAFETAVSMAREQESEIAAVHVLHTPLAHSVEQFRDDIKDIHMKNGELLLEKYQKIAVERGMQHMPISMEYGVPKFVLPKEAAVLYRADLIVAGATGAGVEKGLRLGSVSEGIVRRASCDVLIIRNKSK